MSNLEYAVSEYTQFPTHDAGAETGAGAVLVIVPQGQVHIANRQQLKQLVVDALAAGRRRIVIDFAHTGYVDHSGLGVLVSVSKRIRELGGVLVLSSLNSDVKTLFELTKLDTLFHVADTRTRAIDFAEREVVG
jgi:anti-sigma B factor antagonist